MIGVAGQSWVVNLGNLGVSAEELRQRKGVAVLPLDAQAQRLEASQQHRGLMGLECPAGQLAEPIDGLD